MDSERVIIYILGLTVLILPIVGWWRIFSKAGEKGWKCLLPIYNIFIFLRIIKRPDWWIFLYFLAAGTLIFLPFTFLLLYMIDTWRLNDFFGYNNQFYDFYNHNFPHGIHLGHLLSKKGYKLIVYFAFILGQNLVYASFGMPHIAFGKKNDYNEEFFKINK